MARGLTLAPPARANLTVQHRAMAASESGLAPLLGQLHKANRHCTFAAPHTAHDRRARARSSHKARSPETAARPALVAALGPVAAPLPAAAWRDCAPGAPPVRRANRSAPPRGPCSTGMWAADQRQAPHVPQPRRTGQRFPHGWPPPGSRRPHRASCTASRAPAPSSRPQDDRDGPRGASATELDSACSRPCRPDATSLLLSSNRHR